MSLPSNAWAAGGRRLVSAKYRWARTSLNLVVADGNRIAARVEGIWFPAAARSRFATVEDLIF